MIALGAFNFRVRSGAAVDKGVAFTPTPGPGAYLTSHGLDLVRRDILSNKSLNLIYLSQNKIKKTMFSLK